MKKTLLAFIVVLSFPFYYAIGQQIRNFARIDKMLVNGEYTKVIDTCKYILHTDSLNAEIWYRLGLGYQNQLPDEKSFKCFLKAAEIDPDNNRYLFMVGKGYFNKNRNTKAKPIFIQLCTVDSMNWSYAYYLTGIYMKETHFDDAIKIYLRFYYLDSTNYIILDKLGFAYLRKREFATSINLYNRSLAKNKENLNAIKNLSYLYPFVHKTDTAIQLLTRGMNIDPNDMDLYARRASIFYSRNRAKLYLDDYLKILASGDSSVLYLKRTGIGFFKSQQYKEAGEFLEKAYSKDTTDTEVLDYLAKSFHDLRNLKLSQYYYLKKIELLAPLSSELADTYVRLGYEYLADKMYNEAVEIFIKSNKMIRNPSLILAIANLYDERLNNVSKAIYY